jgi:hypothetical protein
MIIFVTMGKYEIFLNIPTSEVLKLVTSILERGNAIHLYQPFTGLRKKKLRKGFEGKEY